MSYSVSAILKFVAERSGITYAEIISPRRTPHLHEARLVALLLARRHTLVSYPTMAKVCGDRDHTSILYLVRQAQKRLETDPVFRDKITLLETVIFAPVVTNEAQLFLADIIKATALNQSLVKRLEEAKSALKQAKDALAIARLPKPVLKKEPVLMKEPVLKLKPVYQPAPSKLCPFAAEYVAATIARENAFYSIGEKHTVQRLEKAKVALMKHTLNTSLTRIPDLPAHKEQSHAHHA